jgi:hypothetical protein
MNAEMPDGPAVAAFGDLTHNRWGVAVGGPEPTLAMAPLDADESAPQTGVTFATEVDGTWTLTPDGAGPHTVSPLPTGTPVATSEADPAPAATIELCRVTDGELTAGGVRCPALPGGRLDSIRLVAAWFPDERAFAILSARPRGANGQDRDAILALALGEPEGMALFDPRLSTGYGADGAPQRTGLEVWIGETEDGDQYPRRVAGEATGAHARGGGSGFRWEAYALRCHSRGEDGAGVYLLIRPA